MRAIVRRIHFALGIVLSIPLAVIGLTGSILAIGDDAALPGSPAPAARATTADRPRAVDIDAIVGAARAGAPPGARPMLYVAGARGTPARVVLSTGTLFVDPVSLAITKPIRRGWSLYGFAHDLHANMLGGPVGRRVVGWLGVAMIVLGLTGPIAWWPGRRRVREGFIVRRDAGRIRWFRDLHRTVGIWSFLFLLFISVTGTFIVFPEPIGRAVEAIFPGRPVWRNDAAGARSVTSRPPMSAGAAVALAREEVGPADVRSVSFGPERQPMRIEFAAKGSGAPDRSVSVLVDRSAQRIVDVRDPRSFTPGERIVSALRPLHEGRVLGGQWRAALVCIGLFPAYFAVTGMLLWILKSRRGRRATLRSSGVSTR